jgi:hypothetical protein
MVTLVCAEVFAETIDALGQQRNLDFGRAGVVGGALELRDYTGFLFSGKRHLGFVLKSEFLTCILRARILQKSILKA